MELGGYVRSVREARELKQADLARKAEMRGAQLSLLENGANVEIQFYEKVARAMGFRGALEMFTSGADRSTRKLLRLWKALPDDAARKDALSAIEAIVVGEPE